MSRKLIEAGLLHHDEGFSASQKVFETKEEFLSAIMAYCTYLDEFGRVWNPSDYWQEERISNWDTELELEVIEDTFLRGCVCTYWEGWDGDGTRFHWELSTSSKGGGSPAWSYDYYTKFRLEHKHKKELNG